MEERRSSDERIARMEQQIENVCGKVESLENRVLIIDQKLDAALVNKADKTEVEKAQKESEAKLDKLSDKLWALMVATVLGLFGISGSLIVYIWATHR